jgi:VIT1/CCC1 family predicted Fe2+/Mn2+ transporter
MSQQESWFQEKQSAWLYRQLAQAETDARMRALFTQLADMADGQAAIWKQNQVTAAFTPGMRARVVATLFNWIPPRRMRPVLAAMKLRGLSAYDAKPAGHEMPANVQEIGLRHRGFGGGNLRAAVFGVNDGLVSNACLIMGVAGASASNSMILTSGVAGLLAGAFSMAAGEYVSMRSQREMFEYQIGLERDELAEYPHEEAEELALIYEARGMPLARAREFSQELMRDPKHALDVLAREELGLNPDDLGSPWGAALFSLLAFSVGALVPLLPYLIGLVGNAALRWSALAAGASLFGVGMVLSLFSGRNAWVGGLRMLLIGSFAALMTYGIGQLLGTAIS